jgi:hypothetical protein
MKRFLVRIIGIALIVAAIAGLIFSVVGIIVVARTAEQVETALMQQLELVDGALTATGQGLAVAEASLAQATRAAASLEGIVGGVGQAVEGTAPMVDSVAVLLGEQLPATFETTQRTLSSLATTAQTIDDFLALVTSIPFLGLERYEPEQPLAQGVIDVAASLDGIPQSLGEAQQGLNTASGSLQELQADVGTMGDSIAEIATSLENAQTVLVQYQGIIADLDVMVTSAQAGLPQWLHWLRLGLSLLLVWLGIAQIGLMTQGWELISRSRERGE